MLAVAFVGSPGSRVSGFQTRSSSISCEPGRRCVWAPENESPTACISSYRPYPLRRVPGPPSMTTCRRRPSRRSRQRVIAVVASARGIGPGPIASDCASSSFPMKWKHCPASLNCRRKAASGTSVRGLGQSRSGFEVAASRQYPGGAPVHPKQSGGARSPSLKRSRRTSGRGGWPSWPSTSVR